MAIKHLPRPRYQRAFVRWFDENRTSFEMPVRVTKITARGVELKFKYYPDCLSVFMSSNELNVHVNWQGRWWDMLISLDAYIARTPDGYQCKLCMDEHPESATLFSSREALWLDHLFDPFLQWVNEKLAPARWLQISGARNGGATWASLIPDESALDESDRTLFLMRKLVRIDGQSAYDGGTEGVLNWLLPLKSDIDTLAQ